MKKPPVVIGSAFSRGLAASRTARRMSDLHPDAWLERPSERSEKFFNLIVNMFSIAMAVVSVLGIGMMIVVQVTR